MAAVLDELQWDGVIASLAGDDVIFLVVRSEAEQSRKRPKGVAGELYRKMEDLLYGQRGDFGCLRN